MNRKMMVFAAVSMAVAFLAVTAVTASSWTNTPLFTVRMEKASSKMNFLPTAVNGFTYTAEKGYNVKCNVTGYCGEELLGNCTDYDTTCEVTCPASCTGTCNTCQGMFTCDDTSCQPTCPGGTCSPTCWDTCPIRTCIETLCHCPP